MATSTPASASSPASINPVGPPPAMTTACSVIDTRPLPVVRQRDLQHLRRSLERVEPLRDPLDGQRQPRQPPERDRSRCRHLHNPLSEGGPRLGWMEVADLAAHDRDPVVVELVAEQQPATLALVEPDRDDRPAPSNRADRLVERERRARALPGDRDPL